MKLYGLESEPKRAELTQQGAVVYYDEELTEVVVPETEVKSKKWNCSYSRFGNHPTYGEIVSAIIGEQYSTDDQYAIMANYQLDGETEEYLEFQARRRYAKDVAKAALEVLKGGA